MRNTNIYYSRDPFYHSIMEILWMGSCNVNSFEVTRSRGRNIAVLIMYSNVRRGFLGGQSLEIRANFSFLPREDYGGGK